MAMDLMPWLWERVVRGDSPVAVAAALNEPRVRDALLREAAVQDGWMALAAAAQEAGAIARQAGLSEGGPDAVAGVCLWVSADRMLRGVPQVDRAAVLAAAVAEAWSAPAAVADALAGQAPLQQSAAEAYGVSLAAATATGPARDLLEELDGALADDPHLAASALADAAVRDALLRRAAMTGEWEELLAAARDAADAARGAPGPEVVAGVCELVLGDPAAASGRFAAHPDHPLAVRAAAAGDPAGLVEMLAAAAPLDDLAARRFLDGIDPPVAAAPDPAAGRGLAAAR